MAVFGSINKGMMNNESLNYVAHRGAGNIGLPLNSLNLRTSAHFLEINHIFQAEMIKRYTKTYSKHADDRSKLSPKEQKTKYAHPSYVYVPMKPAAKQASPFWEETP